jgi:hypothetical protein
LLAGLAAQSVTNGSNIVLWAFGTTALVFLSLLFVASVGVTTLRGRFLEPVRMVGSSVKKSSGYVLMAVGAWFIVLAASTSPTFGI